MSHLFQNKLSLVNIISSIYPHYFDSWLCHSSHSLSLPVVEWQQIKKPVFCLSPEVPDKRTTIFMFKIIAVPLALKNFFLVNLCDLLPFLFFGLTAKHSTQLNLHQRSVLLLPVSNSLFDILLLSRFRTYKTYIHLSCSFIILIGN